MALTPVWFPVLPSAPLPARSTPLGARVVFVDEPFSPVLPPAFEALSARTATHAGPTALPAMTPFAPLPVPVDLWQTIYILPTPKRKEL
jgi:hypothetical protein